MAAVMSGVLLAGCSSASTDNAAQTTAAQSEAAGTETSAEGASVTEAAADVDDELAQIQKSGVFKVGVEGTYPPMTYHDESGELTGFDVEVAKKVAEKLGVTAVLTANVWIPSSTQSALPKSAPRSMISQVHIFILPSRSLYVLMMILSSIWTA